MLVWENVPLPQIKTRPALRRITGSFIYPSPWNSLCSQNVTKSWDHASDYFVLFQVVWGCHKKNVPWSNQGWGLTSRLLTHLFPTLPQVFPLGLYYWKEIFFYILYLCCHNSNGNKPSLSSYMGDKNLRIPAVQPNKPVSLFQWLHPSKTSVLNSTSSFPTAACHSKVGYLEELEVCSLTPAALYLAA